jgi:hypothetical protein
VDQARLQAKLVGQITHWLLADDMSADDLRLLLCREMRVLDIETSGQVMLTQPARLSSSRRGKTGARVRPLAVALGHARRIDLFRAPGQRHFIRRTQAATSRRRFPPRSLLPARLLPRLLGPQGERLRDSCRRGAAQFRLQHLDPPLSFLQTPLQRHHQIHQPLGVNPPGKHIVLEPFHIVHSQFLL